VGVHQQQPPVDHQLTVLAARPVSELKPRSHFCMNDGGSRARPGRRATWHDIMAAICRSL
jgi:hypothetical protein